MPERLPYLVEPMTLNDIGQVMEIEQVVFPAPWSARAYRYEITQNEYSTMLVLRPAGTLASPLGRLKRRLGIGAHPPIVGYAGLWLLVDEAHICTIAVHPQWQGQGLGEMLLLSSLDQAINLGAARATLEVRVSNSAAIALYLKYDFEIVARRKRYYTDNNEDAYIMTTSPFETARFQTNLAGCRVLLYARLRTHHANASTRGDASSLASAGRVVTTREQRAG